jgi:hypothetical protein
LKHVFVKAAARPNNRAENSRALHSIANNSRRDSLSAAKSPKSPEIRPTFSERCSFLPSFRLSLDKLTKPDGLLPEDTTVRSSKYLNNVNEQHDRNVKSRANVMLGFKRFSNAAVIIAGVELAHRIRKGQFDFAELGFKENHCARRLGGRPCCTMK